MIDLLIAGAGPAGLSVALHLLKQDPSWAGRMLLLEKAAHPRPKLCGGAVTRLGLDLLRDLGFELPLPIPQARVDDVRLSYAGRLVHVRGHPQLAIFHRAELDAYLAEQARSRGAVILENEPVKSFSIQADGVTVATPRDIYQARALVGADGSRGIVRQVLARSERRTRVARLLEVLTPAEESALQFLERYAWFDFTPAAKKLQGYFWDFPSRLGGQPVFNRGIYDARLSQSRERAALPELLHAGLAGLDADPQGLQLSGHPIHWFSPRSRYSLPRLLLVGDAAGADPLFGEGIAPALGYGQVAAQVLQHAFRIGDFSFNDYRLRLFRSPVGRYLLARWLAAYVSYHLSDQLWFMHMMWTLGQVVNTVWPKPPPLY